MPSKPEPHNPFYLLLLIVGVIFVATVLAYALLPFLEQKALDAGTRPPESPFRDGLRVHGWKWVLGEVALLMVLGFASMGLDRYRRWIEERDQPAPKADVPHASEGAQSAATEVESPPPG